MTTRSFSIVAALGIVAGVGTASPASAGFKVGGVSLPSPQLKIPSASNLGIQKLPTKPPVSVQKLASMGVAKLPSANVQKLPSIVPSKVVTSATKPAMIDARPVFHWMATTKPFPNATAAPYPGGKGKVFGVPYELGMRNATVSDFGIAALGVAVGPSNPILGGAAAPWLAGKGVEGGLGWAFKKAHGNGPGPSANPTGNPFIMSAKRPSWAPRW